MGQRLLIGLLALTDVVWAQRRVDPRNTYHRAICVVPFIGKGTYNDPRRPEYAPWPPSQGRSGIIGFSFQASDDGRFAIVELVATARTALETVLADKTIACFEKGVSKRAEAEAALKKYKKNFAFEQSGMVLP